MRVLLQPGFQGARIGLTDFFSLPGLPEDGRFGIALSPEGKLSIGTGKGELTPTPATLEPGQWHTLGFAWDCGTGTCKLTADYQPIADLPQLSTAPGVCYLRLWSSAAGTDDAGMLVESADTRATAW